MKRFVGILVGVLLALPISAASADTISASGVVHITGVVPEMRFIVVNAQGNITEITSNTPNDITPKVYLGSVQNGTELPLTPALLKDYHTKIAGKDLHSTDLYFAIPSPQAAKAHKPALLDALRNVSILRFVHSL